MTTTADLTTTAIEQPLPAAIEAETRRYQRSARSENTLRAYRASLAAFSAWCRAHDREALPAAPDTVSGFLADQATQGKAAATLSLRAAAIAFAHRAADLANPCDSVEVTETLRGVRRERAQERKGRRPAAPLTVTRLASCLATLDRETTRGLRDAVLLSLGFAIGARRSELVALDLADLEDDGDGLRVTVHRAKTDQTGEGATLYVPLASDARLCAVRAVRAWLVASSITEGALLRTIAGHDRIGERLTDRSVDLVVRRCCKRAGLDREGRFSAHSLRSGLVTTLAERGRTEVQIMRQSRHRSSAMVRCYTRDVDAKAECPLRGAY